MLVWNLPMMFDSIPTSQTSTSSLVNHFRSQRTTTSASHTSSTLSLGSSSMTFTNVRSATHHFSSPYKQLTSPAAIRAASSAAAWKAWENDMAEKVKNIYIYIHICNIEFWHFDAFCTLAHHPETGFVKQSCIRRRNKINKQTTKSLRQMWSGDSSEQPSLSLCAWLLEHCFPVCRSPTRFVEIQIPASCWHQP